MTEELYYVEIKNNQVLEIGELKDRIAGLRNEQKESDQSLKELDDAVKVIAPHFQIKKYDKNVVAGIIKKVVVFDQDHIEVVWSFRDEYSKKLDVNVENLRRTDNDI